jgi:hypothetical protein
MPVSYAAQDPACGYRHEESRPDDGREARQADWVAGQLRLGRIGCPDPAGLAGRLGDTVWTLSSALHRASGLRAGQRGCRIPGSCTRGPGPFAGSAAGLGLHERVYLVSVPAAEVRWTAALQWSSVSGSRVREQCGFTAGHEGSAAELTVRKARRNYICSGRSCNHLIRVGTLHGAELYYEHYCPLSSALHRASGLRAGQRGCRIPGSCTRGPGPFAGSAAGLGLHERVYLVSVPAAEVRCPCCVVSQRPQTRFTPECPPPSS